MFQALRPNNIIYIFYRGENSRLEKGVVLNQPIVRQKYQMPASFRQSEMVVDLNVRIDGRTVNYTNLPANLDISNSSNDGESLIVADNKEAMNAELLSLKQESLDIINSKEAHEKLLSIYDNILFELNPEYAEKEAQKEELASLKIQVNEMSNSIKDLMETNKKLLERLS